MSADSLSAKYGVSKGTLQRRALRYAWTGPGKLAKRLATPIVQNAMEQYVAEAIRQAKPAMDSAIEAWTNRSQSVAGRMVEKVSMALERISEPDALNKLATTLNTSDLVGRRALGLDRPDTIGGQPSQVLILLGQQADAQAVIRIGRGLPVDHGQPDDAQAIDVQAEPAEGI